MAPIFKFQFPVFNFQFSIGGKPHTKYTNTDFRIYFRGNNTFPKYEDNNKSFTHFLERFGPVLADADRRCANLCDGLERHFGQAAHEGSAIPPTHGAPQLNHQNGLPQWLV